MFVKESHAIALFPGGFGTHDEGYETLTLMQTGKSELVPVVYIDSPGGSYWKDWDAYVQKHLHGRGMIGEHDRSLYSVTDSVDEAVAEITNFYSNYHSNRYVGDKLVLRVRRAPDPEQLEALAKEKEAWGELFCRRCGYCMPCPSGLNIPFLLLLEGYYNRYELKDWAISRMGTQEKKYSDCTECGECLEKCPYSLPIPELMKRAERLLQR